MSSGVGNVEAILIAMVGKHTKEGGEKHRLNLVGGDDGDYFV